MKKLIIIILLCLFIGSFAWAQHSASFWYPDSDYLRPVVDSWGIRMPSLVDCDTIDTNADGQFTCGTDASGGGGTPNILDLGDDSANESTDLIEIATVGDTNSIFTEPSADKLLIAVGNDWPKADTADDLTCTNCIGQTEITDDYVLNTSDIMTGTLTVEGTTFTLGKDAVNANRTQTIWAENGYEANLKFLETPTYGMGIRYNASENILYMDRYSNSATPSGSNMAYRIDGTTIFEGNTLVVDVPDSRVGINDTTPDYGLDVNGTFRATGLAQLATGTSVNDIDITVANSDNALITSGGVFDGLAAQDACSEITGCVVGAITDGNTGWDNSYGFITGNENISLTGDVSGSGTTAITTTIGANKVLESHLKAVDSPADEECLTYEVTSGDFEWQACGGGGGAPTDVDYLVGTANGTLTNEIVVGTTPGGELGGTWASPTVDDLFIKLAGDITGNLTSDLNIDSNTLVVDYDTNEVGIGIADPLARLHVNYPASGNVIFQAGTGDGGADMDLKYGYNGYGWYNRYLGSGSGDGNQWQLWSEGAGSTDMQVYGIMQSGNIQFMKMLSLNAGTSVNDIDITVANDDNALITSGGVFDGLATKQALDADLTTLAGSTAWRVFYSNGSSVITELALGADNTYLMSNGAALAPTFESIAAGGDITDVFNCSTGDCAAIVMGAADSLDCSSGDINLNNDSVDDADINWAGLTDLAAGGVVSWGNITAGELADNTVRAADIDTINCGRSTTWDATNDEVDADAELYTDVKCIYFEDPTATDDFKSIWTANGFGATITKMWCESDQTVNMDLQVDDGTPADVNGTDLVCDSTPAEDESMGGDATLADGNRLDLAITSVSGTPTWVSICFTYTKDD